MAICGVANADTLMVPTEYATISAAVSAAQPGDTVWVSPGNYWEEMIRVPSGVSVISTGQTADTNIGGRQGSITIEFLDGTAPALLRGFRVSASYSYQPPVIVSHNPNAIVESCRVYSSGPGDWYDPGIVLYDGGTFRNCEIENGHGFHMFWLVNPGAQLLVEDCTLGSNLYPQGMDGMPSGSSLRFQNCTLYQSQINPQLYVPSSNSDFSVEFENCIFYISFTYVADSGERVPDILEFRDSCWWIDSHILPEGSYGPGNFEADPDFCEPPNWLEDTPNEAWLDEYSPCIGTGSGGENIGARYGVCGVTGVEELPTSALGTRSLMAWPNPARDRVSIQLRSPQPAEAGVEVVNAAGQRVRALQGPTSGQETTFEWDTKDDAGRDVPAGVYFLRLSGGADESPSYRLTVVR